LLQLHYDGSALIYERRAYRRVLKWQKAVAQIVNDYDRISPEAMLAVIKEETQGKTGNQVSMQKAVGLTQIKYQGAWAFIWNAFFKKSVKTNGKLGRDYYNQSIRKRYQSQLKRIKNHLIKHKLLYQPSAEDLEDFRWARSKTWEKLKKYLNKKFKANEYQVAVDISAMYLDHLTFQINDYSAKVAIIKQLFDTQKVTDIDQTRFSGSTQAVWRKLRHSYISDLIKIYRETNQLYLNQKVPRINTARLWPKVRNDIKYRLKIDINQLLKERLALIVAQTNDPKTSYAAYHTGPTTIFEYLEKACILPTSAVRYAQSVERHKIIFTDLAVSKKLLTSKENAFHEQRKRL